MTSNDRERAIVESLRRIIRAVDLHSRRLAIEHGLTAPQLAALQEIERTGTISPGELARRIYLSAGTVTGIVSRLERRGLVVRAASAVDRRRSEVRVSAVGLELLAGAPSLLQDRFRRSLERLQSWEQHMLLSSLQRIASMMDATDLDAAPYLTIGEVAAPPTSAAVAPPIEEPVPNGPLREGTTAPHDAGSVLEAGSTSTNPPGLNLPGLPPRSKRGP